MGIACGLGHGLQWAQGNGSLEGAVPPVMDVRVEGKGVMRSFKRLGSGTYHIKCYL